MKSFRRLAVSMISFHNDNFFSYVTYAVYILFAYDNVTGLRGLWFPRFGLKSPSEHLRRVVGTKVPTERDRTVVVKKHGFPCKSQQYKQNLYLFLLKCM